MLGKSQNPAVLLVFTLFFVVLGMEPEPCVWPVPRAWAPCRPCWRSDYHTPRLPVGICLVSSKCPGAGGGPGLQHVWPSLGLEPLVGFCTPPGGLCPKALSPQRRCRCVVVEAESDPLRHLLP